MRNLTVLIGFVLAACLLGLPMICVAQEKIAFASNRDGNYEIYAMNPDGSGQTRLTNNSANDSQPSFSLDGSKIAFASDREGNFKIFVMNANGSNLTRLTNNPQDDFSPSFSPDGTKITFVSKRDGNQEIYVMNADGTGQTRLTNDPGNDAKPSFSHDSTKIVFESLRVGNNDIYKIDVDGTNTVRLTDDPGNDGNPTFRPDSSRIVFHTNRDGNYQIYDMYGDGSGQQRLTNNAADDLNPTYSRNGNRIAFQSSRDGNVEIYDMYSNGNDQTRLTGNLADDLAASCGGFPVVQTIVPVNGVTPTLNEITIDNSTGDQFDPHVSGDWVAYTTDSPGPNYSIRYYNFATNTGGEIPSTASEFDELSEIKGSKIVFSRAAVGFGTRVMIFDAATPAVAPVPLTMTPGNSQFDVSIGGNTVAFIDTATHVNGDLVVYDLTTSTATWLTNATGPQNNLGGPEVSDDGNVVIWTRSRTSPYFEHAEIWQAVKTAGVWKVSIVSTGPEQRRDEDADTNGSIVTYSSVRGGAVFNSSIIWRSVTGGACDQA